MEYLCVGGGKDMTSEDEFFEQLKVAFLRVYNGETRVDVECEKSTIVAYWVREVLRIDVKPKRKLPMYKDVYPDETALTENV